MTIALVLHPFGEKEVSGLGRASYALAKALIDAHPEHRFHVLTKNTPAGHGMFSGAHWEAHAAGGRFWLDKVCMRASEADAHIFFTPIMPFLFRPRRAIVFAHDFAYARLREGNSLRRTALRWMHGRALRRAAAVIAVSEFTKKEVVDIFGIAPEKISVIYNGVNDMCAIEPQALNGIERPYFLYAGVIKSRKNVLDIVKGFAEFMREHNADVRLILAGKGAGSYAQEVEAEIARSGVGDKVRMTGYVSDAELSYLYRNALAFVYPTKLEGFGMAILESMSCGVPTLISSTPALLEAAGGAALAAEATPSGIAAGLRQLWSDEAMRERLRDAGKRRAAQFSWERSARRLMNIVCTVVG